MASKLLQSIPIFITVSLIFGGPMIADGQEIRLIVRGNDFGMTEGSLPAFEKAFNDGVLTCASILVQAPWFEGAANLAGKNPPMVSGGSSLPGG